MKGTVPFVQFVGVRSVSWFHGIPATLESIIFQLSKRCGTKMNPRDRDVFEVLVAMIIGGSVGLVLLHMYQIFG